MGKIVLEGMKFFAYHGYYKEEQTLGNHFLVDVYVELYSQEKNEYETIYLIVKHEMAKTSKLLENVTERIVKSIKKQYSSAETLVRIKKCNPPLGGRVQYSVVDSTGRIGLEGMEFFTPIGMHHEDKTLANEFVVDVHVYANVQKAFKSDNLDDTLNYEALFWAAKTEMEIATELPDEAAERIVENLKRKYSNIFQIEVDLRKKYPPVAGQIPEASIQIEYDHEDQCAKCQKDILCYSDENCWCHDIKILPATQRMLDKLYRGCLCSNCLKSYAVKIN